MKGTYLFATLFLDGGLHDLDGLDVVSAEDHHYLVVECVHVDALVPPFVGAHVHNLVQREPPHFLYAV